MKVGNLVNIQMPRTDLSILLDRTLAVVLNQVFKVKKGRLQQHKCCNRTNKLKNAEMDKNKIQGLEWKQYSQAKEVQKFNTRA